ncbi:MAG: hypothetical protein IPK17_38735 [Chloroflexi bacterium]|uniref:hypothetical protein n=1 Tax=Candidatus Flexifilum breve TaxID=3140694 RepID=UPI0031365D4A|nr:hypothetical protein [Chloroflexota bacterium]
MTKRALIWAAVSTKAQADEDDKFSLPIQEDDARTLAERSGWRVVDVLRVPGIVVRRSISTNAPPTCSATGSMPSTNC